MNQIPAEHLTQLQAATTAKLIEVRDHNLKQAKRDWAAGRLETAKRWYGYVDTCNALLDERHGRTPAAAAEPKTKPAAPAKATDAQVDTIAKLIMQDRHLEGGFSGLVASLHTDDRPDRDAIAKLTRRQASQVIDSLTGSY